MFRLKFPHCMLLAASLLFGTTACDEGHDHDDHDDHDDDGDNVEDVEGITMLTGDATAGEMLFANCSNAACHGATGGEGAGPDLAEEVPEHSDAELAAVIRYGDGDMPALSQLSDQEIADLLAYLRATFQ